MGKYLISKEVYNGGPTNEMYALVEGTKQVSKLGWKTQDNKHLKH